MPQPPLWPHQVYAIDECQKLLNEGEPQRAVVSCQTGGGKTKIMTELIVRTGARIALYTHRKLLLTQTSRVLEDAGIDFGIRADGYEYAREHKVQLCSMQTIASRVLRGRENVHQSDLVFIDEAHLLKSATMDAIMDRHPNAHLIGFTATPVDIGHFYDKIIQAGSTSSLRDCGALLWCRHYGCPEMDLRKVKLGSHGEYTENELKKIWNPAVIIGSVHEHLLKLNPDLKPTILFAPGVAESREFAEELTRRGIPSAHISGESIWLDGEVLETTQENRDEVLERSRTGEVKVICNRFVLREGLDLPHLAHLVFATPFGSICSYLQAGGRLLRNHPSLTEVTVADHGGNGWRHGSLNADREWSLNSNSNVIRGLRERSIRQRKEPEPITCPQCYYIRLSGKRCPQCGKMYGDRKRTVLQTSGKLSMMEIAQFRPRRPYKGSDAASRWRNYYARGLKSRKGLTFNQIVSLFAMENYWCWPASNLPLMPKRELDFYRKVNEVPPNLLIDGKGAEGLWQAHHKSTNQKQLF